MSQAERTGEQSMRHPWDRRLGVWYVAGMLIPALVGMLAGPRLLRW